MAERQRWRKLGHIYRPEGSHPLMRTHAAVPHADHISDDLFRIYFSSRDGEQRSRTFSLTIDIARPGDLLELHTKPFLDLGELGAFDDSGAMLTWITRGDYGSDYFYFIGWNRRVTIPFQNALGVAIVKDGRVVRRFRGPVMDRTMTEPHFVANACVLREHDHYQCWYLSCTGWTRDGNASRHRYHIKYATSSDGLAWRRDGMVAIDYSYPNEHAISRPTVIKHAGRYRMWFSHRGDQYRIGYAESDNGVNWHREDAAVGLDLSENSWDSKALAYPHVFEHRGSLFMLYNGNDYGRTGFGLAVLESS
jgi:hypothetical protein